MFGRLKKWVARASDSAHNLIDLDRVGAWAHAQGYAFERLEQGGDFALAGALGGKPWRLQRSHSDKDFIHGPELRARADLALEPAVSVMLINRPLKDALEQRVFEQVTHGVQTTVDGDLPEEVRWLALYDQVGWSSAPLAFWDRYAIVADTRIHAQQWLDDPLMDLLLDWPSAAVQQMTPFILQLQGGRVYLRMEYGRTDLAALEHVLKIFLQACASARTQQGL